jgi:vacuolar-type H+-ATPase subunit H
MTIVTERCRNNIRNALKTYKTTVDQAKNRLEQVKRDFGDEAEARERERLENQLKNARNQAEAVIRDSHREAVENTMKWGQLDGSKLTDDAKLLTAGLVDPAEFDRLKTKYHDNATMLKALKKYGEQENGKRIEEAKKHGELVIEGGDGMYTVSDISTADDRIMNWNKFQKSAVNRLDMIDGSGAYNDSWNQAFAKAFDAESGIDEFGEGIDL